MGGGRRPSSSAETSIDEDTGDQLLADDFVFNTSPLPSRQGTMNFPRPTSSAFENHPRRSASITSSHVTQKSPVVAPIVPIRHSQQPSLDDSIEPTSPHTSFSPVERSPELHQISPRQPSELTLNPAENPFVDPTEKTASLPPPEKPLQQDSEIGPPAHRRISRKKITVSAIIFLIVILVVVLVPVGVLVIKPKSNGGTSSTGSSSGPSTQPGILTGNGLTEPSTSDPSVLGIPPSAVGTVLDSTKWLDWTDFNVTYTNATVGGLSVMGLNSTWNDSTQANSNVPPLTDTFPYGTQPINGICVGGWFILEPYITPSYFDIYPQSLGIIDEWTLSSYLGPQNASYLMEMHYATFYNRSTFQEIREAGFDHVRLSFPYWFIDNVNPTDPYVAKIGWRYLLRCIEYCRENGLRVNLVLHAAPGSQNGWNHSGRQGVIGWLNGTDGEQNAQLTTSFLEQLATFFSQPRYTNLVTMFSILNEPNMILLGASPVDQWSQQAYKAVRNNGYNGTIVISDGFLPPDDFIGVFPQATYPGLIIDMHNYVIFDSGNLAQTHQEKIGFACVAVATSRIVFKLIYQWSQEIGENVDPTQGFGGPTIVGEWSIADTDCAVYVNSVGEGSRWEGTYSGSVGTSNAGVPGCATGVNCSCVEPNANASDYTDTYAEFLTDFYIAQASSFQTSWGWFYWTWDTENATQWSYKKLLAAGIVSLQEHNSFNCSVPPPDYLALGLPETV